MEDKDVLKEILSQDEYTDYHHASGGGFWDWLDPVFRWVKGLFPNFDAPSDGVVSLFTYALITVLLVLLSLAIYWFVKQLVRQDRARVHTYLPVDGIIQSYSYYWKMASEFDALGDWREGVRAVFLSLVFYLDDQQRIKVERWKTNWEYASELAHSDITLVSLFHDCSILFERAWYGNEAVDQDEFHAIYARVEQVIGKGDSFQNAKVE
jgi:hypothetical protein